RHNIGGGDAPERMVTDCAGELLSSGTTSQSCSVLGTTSTSSLPSPVKSPATMPVRSNAVIVSSIATATGAALASCWSVSIQQRTSSQCWGLGCRASAIWSCGGCVASVTALCRTAKNPAEVALPNVASCARSTNRSTCSWLPVSTATSSRSWPSQ